MESDLTMDEPATTLVTTVTNISNSFISTLDHLPCDIVRSIWLLQSLNLKTEENLNKLDILIRSNKDKTLVIGDIIRLKLHIRRLRLEASEECKYLKMGLNLHKKTLIDDKHTMNDLIKLREENLFENNRANFKQFKIQFLRQIKEEENKPTSNRNERNDDSTRKTRSIAISQFVKGEKPLKLKIKVPKTPNVQEQNSLKKENKTSNKKLKIQVTKPEPIEVYCYCRQGDSGRMIACDNPGCKIEWFHYKCMGLKLNEKITNKWYCPDCLPKIQSKKPKVPKPNKVTKIKQSKRAPVSKVRSNGARKLRRHYSK